jgi:hypothetical protein
MSTLEKRFCPCGCGDWIRVSPGSLNWFKNDEHAKYALRRGSPEAKEKARAHFARKPAGSFGSGRPQAPRGCRPKNRVDEYGELAIEDAGDEF